LIMGGSPELWVWGGSSLDSCDTFSAGEGLQAVARRIAALSADLVLENMIMTTAPRVDPPRSILTQFASFAMLRQGMGKLSIGSLQA
jgi:hypothetical protein